MNAHDENRLKKLLREALPSVDGDAGPERDLWPEVLRRLDEQPAQAAVGRAWGWAWFDGALAVGLVGIAAFFPAAIPLVLYYL